MKAARAILDVDFTVPSETMFTQLKWMTFPERAVYHKAIQIYKTVCGDAPDYLKKYFVTHSFFQAVQFGIIFPEYIKTASFVKHFKSLYSRWYKQYFES